MGCFRPDGGQTDEICKGVGALGRCQDVIDTLTSPGEGKFAPSVQPLPMFYREERDAVAF